MRNNVDPFLCWSRCLYHGMFHTLFSHPCHSPHSGSIIAVNQLEVLGLGFVLINSIPSSSPTSGFLKLGIGVWHSTFPSALVILLPPLRSPSLCAGFISGHRSLPFMSLMPRPCLGVLCSLSSCSWLPCYSVSYSWG